MPRSARPQLRRSALVAGSVVATAALVLAGCGSKASDTDIDRAQRRAWTPRGRTSRSGSLNSLSGTMAITEVTVRDAIKLAVDEINAKGGVLGKQIQIVGEDGASDWPMFAEKAEKLIKQRLRRRGVRRLDLVQPQGDAAGLREQQLTALLPRAVRGPGVVAEHLLHRRHHQPADHARRWTTSRRRASSRCTWSAATTCSRRPPTASSRPTPAANGIEIKGEDYTPLGSTDFSTIVNKVRASEAGRRVQHPQRRLQRGVLQGVHERRPDRRRRCRWSRCRSPRKRSRASARRTSPAS